MRKLAALPLIVLAFAGCGSDDEKSSSASGAAGGAITGQTAPTQSTSTTETATSGEDAEAIADTIRTWLTEGGCELMTDKFLEEQAFTGDTREERCKYLEDIFQKPQYGKDDIVVKDVKVDGDTASAVVADNFSNVEADYDLVRSGGRWLIDDAL